MYITLFYLIYLFIEMFYQNLYNSIMKKNLYLIIKNYFFKKDLKNFYLMFNIFSHTSISFINDVFLSRLSPHSKKIVIRFFLKYMLPVINQLWDFLEGNNYNIFLITYLIYLVLYLCWFFCFLIKKLYIIYSYHMLLNGFYDFALRTHALFYIVNPRGFLNYKYLMRRRSSPEEAHLLNEIFIGTFEKQEARLIYSRMRDYINLLKTRSEDETYYIEEVGTIDDQLSLAFELFESLKTFYRTDGHVQSKWMRSQKFKEKYHFYWETCYHIEKLKKEHNILADSFKKIWLPFVDDLIFLFNNKDEDVLSLNNYLSNNFNFSLNDLKDEKFVTFTIIKNLETALNNLKLNSTVANLILKLNIMQKNVLILSEHNDSIFICEVIISNYLLGVDNLIKNYFDTFGRASIEQYVVDKKKSILIAEQDEIAKNNFKLKYLDPFTTILDDYAFNVASYLINSKRNFVKNLKNFTKKYPDIYIKLKTFKKNYKKAKTLQIKDIKALFSAWWDSDL